MKHVLLPLLLLSLLSCLAMAQSPTIEKVQSPGHLQPAPQHTGGRTLPGKAEDGSAAWQYQWPGIYFETTFRGAELFFRVDGGDQILHVGVDGQTPVILLKPAAGLYRIGTAGAGSHAVRIEVVNESQSAPMAFGGFWLPDAAAATAPAPRARQIEFIGDSHTVGYGNTHPTRESTPELVWATTDNSQAYSALAAKHCGADYRVNAISGRGIVRNYDGFAADTLPLAYPHLLFGRTETAADPGWHPQVIVIGLGTNDFSTKLNPGEKWKTRDELHADYEATYVRFVQGLRAANPGAFFILESNEAAEGEVHAEVGRVIDLLKSAGEKRIASLTFRNLELTACDWHPSLRDHRSMAGEVTAFLDAHPELWPAK